MKNPEFKIVGLEEMNMKDMKESSGGLPIILLPLALASSVAIGLIISAISSSVGGKSL